MRHDLVAEAITWGVARYPCCFEDAPRAMQCFVYRCAKRAETFVYLARQDDFERIPAPVRPGLGVLSLVMTLDLDARQRLARDDIAVVRSNLQRHGLHIQFPPDIAGLHAQG